MSRHYELTAKQLEKLNGKYPDTKAAYKVLAEETRKMSNIIERDFKDYDKIAEKGALILVADPIDCYLECAICGVTGSVYWQFVVLVLQERHV